MAGDCDAGRRIEVGAGEGAEACAGGSRPGTAARQGLTRPDRRRRRGAKRLPFSLVLAWSPPGPSRIPPERVQALRSPSRMGDPMASPAAGPLAWPCMAAPGASRWLREPSRPPPALSPAPDPSRGAPAVSGGAWPASAPAGTASPGAMGDPACRVGLSGRSLGGSNRACRALADFPAALLRLASLDQPIHNRIIVRCARPESGAPCIAVIDQITVDRDLPVLCFHALHQKLLRRHQHDSLCPDHSRAAEQHQGEQEHRDKRAQFHWWPPVVRSVL